MKRLLSLFLASFFMSSTVFAAININEASEDELKMLDGIGPTRAKAIIKYRTRHDNKFKSLEEIKNVPGIKQAVYFKIKDDITLTGPSTRPEGKLDRAGKAINRAAATTKEKTSKALKSSAEAVEHTAHSVKKKAAHSEATAADKKEKNQ